ncbi:MAG TPA: asparagine synthase (glutamine-hydrolyzing) [Anaeromyxobacteraceae bacterium]|nr:asparagine synthase (glutamine-hydrolyzing) [Anaeromyxobacteraceae bacterium]
MCGITGFTVPRGLGREKRRAQLGDRLRRMTASLCHRGPDAQRGLLLDGAALGHARLAIVDLEGGVQPMRDPRTGVAIVFNGEIFNYVELREELGQYPFRTRSDTEVLLAAYLRWGAGCLERFNGQFAFALFDPRTGEFFLARDRVGILPLYYALPENGIAFASEAKALVAGGFADGTLDGRGVKQAMQLWSTVPPRTCLAGISALPPGCLGRFADGRLEVRRWWDLDLDDARVEPIEERTAVERVGEVLEDAVRLRLRADVPVAAYLSGGLDSSILCAIAQRQLGGTLSTFSVVFADPRFDESRYQEEVAAALATRHHAITATGELTGELLPEVVRHAEQVLIRSAPAPLLALSRDVRRNQVKVVLTGEGSDEVLLGYDLYRETLARVFWARRPSSRCRPAILRRLYPYLPMAMQGDAILRQVYGIGLEEPDSPGFSHLVRWAATARLFRLFAEEFAVATADEDPVATLLGTMPQRARRWRPLARAQWLEMHTLLAGNLLGPQGDRMLMGGSVEGRFPFLDHRLIDLAASLPDGLKLRGLAGKRVLQSYAAGKIPAAVLDRPKFPYRAPPAWAGSSAPAWARELLAPEAVRRVGIFDPDKVRRLIAKLEGSGPVSEVDSMGITAIATAQLLPFVLSRSAPSARAIEAVSLEEV